MTDKKIDIDIEREIDRVQVNQLFSHVRSSVHKGPKAESVFLPALLLSLSE